MAGGMNRKDTLRVPLYQRLRDNPAPVHEPAPPKPDPSSIRHCWVTDEHGRLPGLLLEWRSTASGWQGRVVRPVLEDGGWVMVEEWLPSRSLAPVEKR